MSRFVSFAVLSFALLGLTGCKGACRELSERVCDCASITTLEKQVCAQRAANDENLVEPSSEQEAVCEQKLDTCICGQVDIETTEGKEACGLARDP
jgi:hypothetical protein